MRSSFVNMITLLRDSILQEQKETRRKGYSDCSSFFIVQTRTSDAEHNTSSPLNCESKHCVSRSNSNVVIYKGVSYIAAQ